MQAYALLLPPDSIKQAIGNHEEAGQ